ncbi:cold-shock protein [Entomobacter blattae]|uniref:Cold-shock DNA-binding domain protein n=1 Tax=Entomobacter blattae TaxID=2762277 RepID=A0A7H1NSB2_9PROT|nr:cold-shock protein [Entomobacter blattae]QNT78672.1 Cold-shock DNA-binding domain protein [Entomobacter blattae]
MKNNRTDRSSRSPNRGGFRSDSDMSYAYHDHGGSRGDQGFNSFSSSTPTGPEIGAVVKWFNPTKGFGFVELTDGSGDVFLHANTLNQAGYKQTLPGATLKVYVGNGPKGRQVTEVLFVDESTAEPESHAPRRSENSYGQSFQGAKGGSRTSPDLSHAEEVEGTVKWYNPTKGFGFITPHNGGKDIFIHVSAVERAGLHSLNEGQVMVVQVVQGQKGPEAAAIHV